MRRIEVYSGIVGSGPMVTFIGNYELATDGEWLIVREP